MLYDSVKLNFHNPKTWDGKNAREEIERAVDEFGCDIISSISSRKDKYQVIIFNEEILKL